MFEMFPTNYPWSLTVAMSIGMGGEISEITDACRPLMTAATGASPAAAMEAWYQSWSALAQRLERLGAEAEASNRLKTAASLKFRAVNYNLVAERNISWSDGRRMPSYRRSLGLFSQACALAGHRTERIQVESDMGPLAGYLRLPPGPGPFPAVIFFNGFDSIKEMHYLLYGNDAVERGLAVLFIDQEGTGEAMRLHDIKKRVDSEASAGPFIEALSSHPAIDPERIGVSGVSNGGYDAPRAAAFDGRLKCVACLGAFYNADDYLGRFEGGGGETVTKGLSNLDEHMMKVMGEGTPAAAYRAFAKRDLGGVIERIAVPLLVVHGENDRQVPLWHAERTVAGAVRSSKVDYKVFTLSEGGAEHCGADNTGLQSQYLFDWLSDTLAS